MIIDDNYTQMYIHALKQPSCIKSMAFKSQGEKVVKSKVAAMHEMAAMMLIIININNGFVRN